MESQPSSKEMAKRSPGRPKANIDWEKVDQWLIAGANGAQIAASLGIYPDTLYDACERDHKTTFTTYSQEKRSIGDKLIHQVQFEVAVKNKNTTMLIWLGKQRCGQKDSEVIPCGNPEERTRHEEVMGQLKALQDAQRASARKRDENSSNTDNKSA